MISHSEKVDDRVAITFGDKTILDRKWFMTDLQVYKEYGDSVVRRIHSLPVNDVLQKFF